MCHLSRDTRRRVYGINLTRESRERVIILMERELSKSGVSISVKRKPSLSRRVISHVALNVNNRKHNVCKLSITTVPAVPRSTRIVHVHIRDTPDPLPSDERRNEEEEEENA